MDFTFSEDELALREAVSRFLMVEAAPEVLREIWQEDTGRSPQLRRAIAEQGVMALSIPEAYDGLGMGDVMWSLIAQELGYYAIPDSLIDTAYVAAYLIIQLPDDVAQKATWLQQIGTGELRVSIAHVEQQFVADAHLADVIFYFTADALHVLSGDAVLLVDNPSIDSSRRLFKMTPVTPLPAPILEGNAVSALYAQVNARGAIANAGQQIGLAQRMLDLSIDYVNQRKQFGKLIGSFQALKHKLADVVSAIEMTKPTLYRAAYALEHDASRASLYVAQVVIQARDAAKLAAKHSIQAHGAMGYTWEVDLQMFIKRSHALQASWGRTSVFEHRVLDALIAEPDLADPCMTFMGLSA